MPLGNKVTVNSDSSLESFIEQVIEAYVNHKYLSFSITKGQQRSSSQNRALHLYCENVAQALNDGGYSVNTFFKEGFAVPFSKEIVKHNLWRPLQVAVTGKESTVDPTRQQYTEIYDHLNSKLAEKGLHVPWPYKGD